MNEVNISGCGSAPFSLFIFIFLLFIFFYPDFKLGHNA